MLTVREQMMLSVERQRWRYIGAKEEHVRTQLGYSLTAYYAKLNDLIDRPDALEYDAQLVRRLLRLREQRKAARGAA